MVNYIDSVHAKICWHCREYLQNMIKHLDRFTLKRKKKEVIRLLKNLKKVSTGIDSLGHKLVNYINALKYFVNTIQGPLKRYDGYIKWTILTIETLI